MKSDDLTAPNQVFGQYVILSEYHRALLKTLKSRRRLSYSETIRRGIELVANQSATEPKNPVAHINNLHNADTMSAEVYGGINNDKTTYRCDSNGVFEQSRTASGEVIEKRILERPAWVKARSLRGKGWFDIARVSPFAATRGRGRDLRLVPKIVTNRLPMDILEQPENFRFWLTKMGMCVDHHAAVIRYVKACISKVTNENN